MLSNKIDEELVKLQTDFPDLAEYSNSIKLLYAFHASLTRISQATAEEILNEIPDGIWTNHKFKHTGLAVMNTKNLKLQLRNKFNI